MATHQREAIVHADTEQQLEALLAMHGVVQSGATGGRPGPVDGLGLDWMGCRGICGVALSGVWAHVWVTHLGRISAQQWDALVDALRDHLWWGPPLQHLLGETGPALPVGATWVRWERTRRQLEGGFPLADPDGTVRWWHSDYQSRDQQEGLMLAGVIGILRQIIPAEQWATVTAAPMLDPVSGQQIVWRMMSGGDVPLTIGRLFDLLFAAMRQEGATDSVAQAAIAALDAGQPVDLQAIQWPAVYGEASNGA